VGRGVQQRLVFMLAVQLDQAGGQLLQGAGGGQSSVDERPAAPLSGDLAPHEQLFPAAVENRLDRSQFLSSAHEVTRGPSAEQQPDSLDENRLPRPGLAGEHVEAAIELDLDRVDHRKVADAQEAEHRRERTPIVT
jgi:hypothetical protein